jgi:hypothetical protein
MTQIRESGKATKTTDLKIAIDIKPNQRKSDLWYQENEANTEGPENLWLV